ELALEVAAPALHHAPPLDAAGVGPGERDRPPVGPGRDHLPGHRAVGPGAVAELAEQVPTPAPERVVVLDGAGVPALDRHRAPVPAAADPGRGRVVPGRPDAELAGRVVAPAPQRPVGPDRTGVEPPRAHLSPGAGRADSYGLGPDLRGAVAELAAVVDAPAV